MPREWAAPKSPPLASSWLPHSTTTTRSDPPLRRSIIMKRTAGFVIAGVLVAATAVGHLAGQQPSNDKETPDAAAIKQAGQTFLKAYMSGDAKGMAAHWT